MKKQLISAVLAAAMITGAMGNFAIPVVPKIQSITASAASVADFQGTYNVPVTLINATTGGASMGNAALKQTGTLVIDAQGKATVKLEFHSLTIGSEEGYLGFLRKRLIQAIRIWMFLTDTLASMTSITRPAVSILTVML
jgi:hypothetical protein